ncbi:ficolin-1-like [Drosophila innubila]|uniref:ficolin-1-like n=1 Tax=Drosophila innubila TaxID=198719 RepID=UPI00148D60A4|nr:ficolin-1-like [Drosophila innubila]
MEERHNKSDIQTLRGDIQRLEAELERQKKEIVDKKTKIQLLREELERQGKSIDDLNGRLNNQSLRDEQDRQGKLIDRLVKTSNLRNCAEANSSGIYDIVVPNFSFGVLGAEFFLGLDKIHALTAERSQELLVLLEDFEGEERFELYDRFAIGDEDEQYILHTLGKATGTAGDSLSEHRGMKFTTYDRDNDNSTGGNCAIYSTGAWWYNNCHKSNLAGKYKDNSWAVGINWSTYKGFLYSLKRAVMMIRPRN